MADDYDPNRLNGLVTPTAGTPLIVERTHRSDPNLGPSENSQADAGRPAQDEAGKAMVGAREVDRPIIDGDRAETDDTSHDELHDRLARRDQTPVPDGGSSGLA